MDLNFLLLAGTGRIDLGFGLMAVQTKVLEVIRFPVLPISMRLEERLDVIALEILHPRPEEITMGTGALAAQEDELAGLTGLVHDQPNAQARIGVPMLTSVDLTLFDDFTATESTIALWDIPPERTRRFSIVLSRQSGWTGWSGCH